MTIAFAVMVVGAAASFRLLGHLSDRLGRRRIIVPALLVGILAAVVLAVWPALPGLIVGRVLTGVAVGLMASTATAYLTDLYHEAQPDQGGSPVPALVATAANLGGLALGPLVAGALAQWAPAPVRTAYIIFGTLMAVLLVLVLSSPETVDTEAADKPVRFALRPGLRATFTAFAASAVAQLALGRLTHAVVLTVGTLLFPVGLALTALSLYRPALWLALTAAALAGAGAGLLFKSAVTQTVIAADPASRAGVLAAFFIIAYVGMGLPSIAFSLVIQHLALKPSMIGFAAALSLGAVAAVAVAVRVGRRR